jgi:hypothetical protein
MDVNRLITVTVNGAALYTQVATLLDLNPCQGIAENVTFLQVTQTALIAIDSTLLTFEDLASPDKGITSGSDGNASPAVAEYLTIFDEPLAAVINKNSTGTAVVDCAIP